ncbi:trypsin-like peptidase domain-containing protein [Candidatus Woesearchaeota archaeon]|nr:trypsin-like peptidase domain-containing protein [Candidatus Woesearchaeota archaeon]
MINSKTKRLALALILAFALAGGLLYYINYNLSIIRLDFDNRIKILDEQTNRKVEILQSRIHALGQNISAQIDTVSASLQDFRKQNEKEINTLSSLVDQIEQQSNIQLNELKTELKNIRIKSADFSAVVDDVLKSVVSVSTNLGQGSGVIIDSKGYIVTNVHVISGASKVRIITYSGSTYNINTLVGYDSDADIAVLKVDVSGLDSLPFGDSDNLKVGEKVIAAGNPAGLSFTVTEGIVSAFRTQNGVKYVQTDVPINPGNSGGPLINTKGEIVGINNFKIGGFESLGFAISSNDARKVAHGIIEAYEASQNQ